MTLSFTFPLVLHNLVNIIQHLTNGNIFGEEEMSSSAEVTDLFSTVFEQQRSMTERN